MALVAISLVLRSSKLANVDTGLLELLIDAASDAAERLCHREFKRKSLTENYDGDNQRQIVLQAFPVQSLTTVVFTGSLGSTTTYGAATDPTAAEVFVYEVDTGILRFRPGSNVTRFPRGVKNIAVTYEGGFDPIPSDLQYAIIQMIEHLAAQDESDLGLKSERLGDYQATFQSVTGQGLAAEWPGQVVSVLSRYMDHANLWVL
jgi:hypothetical protein